MQGLLDGDPIASQRLAESVRLLQYQLRLAAEKAANAQGRYEHELSTNTYLMQQLFELQTQLAAVTEKCVAATLLATCYALHVHVAPSALRLLGMFAPTTSRC